LIADEVVSRDDPTELSASLITDRLLIANNVSLHGMAFTAHHLILNLVASDPSLGYIETLRNECRDAYVEAGGKWTLDAVRKLKLVDSALRESMRFAPFSSIALARTVS
jgi:hypothetical protein